MGSRTPGPNLGHLDPIEKSDDVSYLAVSKAERETKSPEKYCEARACIVGEDVEAASFRNQAHCRVHVGSYTTQLIAHIVPIDL